LRCGAGSRRRSDTVAATVQSDATARTARQPTPAAALRVLHVVSESQRRGAELVALELADELDRRGHHNRVVALGPAFDGGREPGLAPLRASWGQRPPDLVACAWRLRRLITAAPVDVVLAHGGWAAQVAACAFPVGGPVLIWQRILGFPGKVWGSGRRRWWATVVRRCDGVVALTPEQRDEIRRLGYRGPVWLIPNFRSSGRFRSLDRDRAGSRLRGEVGVAEETPLIGFVGHLAGQKRPERAMEVLDRLRSQGCFAHLVVAGTGPLRTDLEAQARRLGLDRAVTFLGQRDDIERVLGGVDLVLLTSEAEGMPGVAIEALMAGCPMVAVRVGGVTDVIEHGVTGLVLDDDRPTAMAEAVARLLADDESRAAMGRESRARTDRFSASAAAAVYDERFREALAGR
jgi:glycosyltransferase involved in cell wall biosynthesis